MNHGISFIKHITINGMRSYAMHNSNNQYTVISHISVYVAKEFR